MNMHASARLEREAVKYYLQELIGKDSSWDFLHLRFYSEKNRALVMQLASQALGRVWSRFSEAHLRYPYKTFGLLTGTVTVEQLKADDTCLFDPWTKSLVEHYCDKYDDPGFMLEIHAVAEIAHIDTSAIEARHASIRRGIFGRIQTHVMKLRRASAAFVLRGVSRPRLLLGKLQQMRSRKRCADSHLAEPKTQKAVWWRRRMALLHSRAKHWQGWRLSESETVSGSIPRFRRGGEG